MRRLNVDQEAVAIIAAAKVRMLDALAEQLLADYAEAEDIADEAFRLGEPQLVALVRRTQERADRRLERIAGVRELLVEAGGGADVIRDY